MAKHTYRTVHRNTDNGVESVWEIVEFDTLPLLDGRVVWSMPWKESHYDLDEPPAELRAEYERLLGSDRRSPAPSNIVELCAGSEFNQICAYGALVEGHAVYCHNTSWLYAPGKCRRTWYTGGEVRDEDCPGFMPNPKREGAYT